MILQLNKLIPHPIKDKVASAQSGIWNREVAFRQGDRIFLHAPSGSGKTTLIHILYGMRSDYSGNAQWEQQIVTALNAEALAAMRREKLAIVFQDLRLFGELTAFENIEVKRVLTNTVSRDKVQGWMEQLGIGNKYASLAKTLSYGEQQRVAIIRALAQPFNWLLMDEPFSHLDRANSKLAAQLISDVLSERKAGMLLADLDENIFFEYDFNLAL
jgi:putative ABC transport system ATP-binding protein